MGAGKAAYPYFTSSGRQDSDQDGYQNSDQDGLPESVEERFQLLDAAGMGFFGIVFYALLKNDFAVASSLLRSNPSKYDGGRSLQAVRAVKICNPLCPSGFKASASYIIKDILAMKMLWSRMEEHVRQNFVRLLDYNTSETPWYSMEAVLSGLTLEKVYMASQQQTVPVPEELAFHIVGQMSQACLFLHDKCRIVRADVNRQNVMLRYPGRESKLLPDVVLIDWSLWEEASPERIAKETENVYECLLPVLFEGGWGCGTRHDRQDCKVVSNTTHSSEWVDLYRIMCRKQSSLGKVEREFADVIKQSRRRVEDGSAEADRIRSLLMVTGASLTEGSLMSALGAE